MNFDEFRMRLEKDINLAYPGIRTRQQEVEKMQAEPYQALAIFPEEGQIGININLDSLYTYYSNGRSYSEIFESAKAQAQDFFDTPPLFDVEFLMDYEDMKTMLTVDMVNTQRNAEMLKDVPHKEYEDISMVYRIQVMEREEGVGSILVTNKLLERCGIDPEQLHNDALENAHVIRPARMQTLFQALGSLGDEIDGMPSEAAPQMYVVSTEDMVKGAAAIFYPGMMDACTRSIRQDYFIIPSSVHEVLLVPDNTGVTAAELQDMVRSVNSIEVAREEQLSDHVYHYDSKEHLFELGETYEARKASIAAERSAPQSVLEELKSRQKENDLKPKPPEKAHAQEESL